MIDEEQFFKIRGGCLTNAVRAIQNGHDYDSTVSNNFKSFIAVIEPQMGVTIEGDNYTEQLRRFTDDVDKNLK